MFTYGGKGKISLSTTSRNQFYQLFDQHLDNIWSRSTQAGGKPLGRDAKREVARWENVHYPRAPLPSQRIFINYRRADTGWAASRLYDHLIAHFGRENVFLDHKAISNSSQYRDEIQRHLEQADVFLAVIGPNWTTISANGEHSRLFDEDDLVRKEIEAAIALNKTILRIGVDGAGVLKADQLPPSIQALEGLHSDLTLSFETFTQDARKIARTIERVG